LLGTGRTFNHDVATALPNFRYYPCPVIQYCKLQHLHLSWQKMLKFRIFPVLATTMLTFMTFHPVLEFSTVKLQDISSHPANSTVYIHELQPCCTTGIVSGPH
jgi:hypothetical protein